MDQENEPVHPATGTCGIAHFDPTGNKYTDVTRVLDMRSAPLKLRLY